MSLNTSVFELDEVRRHLEKWIPELTALLRASPPLEIDAESALMVYCQHILEHLCMAWHTRDMSSEELNALTDEQCDEIFSSVPNFSGQLRLLETTELPRRKQHGGAATDTG